MPSTRERVIQGVIDLVKAALPQATHYRNGVKPKTLPELGYVNIDDGVQGEPEIIFSPTTWIYEHEIPVEIIAKASTKRGAEPVEERLDAMLRAIGAAIAADRTLGGLCDDLQVTAPDTEALTAVGATVSRTAVLGIVAVYGVTDPLN